MAVTADLSAPFGQIDDGRLSAAAPTGTGSGCSNKRLPAPQYYRSKAGHRLLRSINEKLALEGLDEHSFEEQIRNDWRVQGKTFHQIFKEVVGEELYAVAYGTFSDSVHGSWQDVLGFSLRGDVDRKVFHRYTSRFARAWATSR